MSLLAHLLRRIRHDGPISVADYMADCLTHPTYGYYATRDPLGVEGDFTTAPEISQMFGELIGLSLAQVWIDQGKPSSFTLAELGPGRGTLMHDVLRATRGVPGFTDAAEIVLLEASATLRKVQESKLADHSHHWIDAIEFLPKRPLFVVANEFFDALPIRQFQRAKTGWHERRIGAKGDALSFGLGSEMPQPALDDRRDDTQEGDVVEYAPSFAPLLSTLGGRIAKHGGAGLIVDYGDWRSLGNTLQAVRNHQPVPVLEQPGQSDLTAHVDFEAIAEAAPCAHSRLTPQGVFLERLGITARAQALARQKPDALESLTAAHRRLTHPEEMGNLFKVLGLFPAGLSPPPGLTV